jgi:hypothetical protein
MPLPALEPADFLILPLFVLQSGVPALLKLKNDQQYPEAWPGLDGPAPQAGKWAADPISGAGLVNQQCCTEGRVMRPSLILP